MTYQICNRCIMDTSDPCIEFDSAGICNHCKLAEKKLACKPLCLNEVEKESVLAELVKKIASRGSGKYDCIIGVSGGVDSTYVAYLVKKLGLKPLAVHLDNGWNSELAVMNIENTLKTLGIDLITHVIDWPEIRDIQLAFLKASTPDIEIPSDHAIFTLLLDIANKFKIKTVITGINTASESILPKEWSQGHFDWKYISSVHKRFGEGKIKTFPHMSPWKIFYLRRVKQIEWVNILDYIEYHKDDAKVLITKELSWRDYGGKHHESNYTKIYQGYLLPKKFGYDKRRAHLSSLIISKQLTRELALNEIALPSYDANAIKDDLVYLVNKFQIKMEEFERIMALPKKRFSDYPSYELNSTYQLIYKAYRWLKGLSR